MSSSDRDADGPNPWPSRADRRSLGLAMLAGVVPVVAYLATHEYPAYGAGLYLAMARRLLRHGYALPSTIPHYTAGGVPFAYPPLGFYLAATAVDLTSLDLVTYSRLVPGLFVLLSLLPYYAVARGLLGTPRRAGLATGLYAVTPAALQWHLSGGGMVRALAMTFALAGAATGLRLFRDADRRWLVPSALLFGLTVLTHPVYTVFFVLTYLLLFVRFDRSPRGLLHGALVAAGGFALAAPWLARVVRVHGIDIFLAASGTHSGLGGGIERLGVEFGGPLVPPTAEIVFYLGAYAGVAYGLANRRWFLPAWLVVPGFLIGKPRFLFVAGSMLTAVVLVERVVPRIRSRWNGRRSDRGRAERERTGGNPPTLARCGVALAVVVAATGVGAAFAAGALDAHEGSASMPAFVDDADRDAMAWAAAETPPSATFVVLGDAAEWFPLFAERTILIGPWGVEWTTAERYRTQLSTFRSISRCENAGCVTTWLDRTNASPDYLYVPKGHYTVRGLAEEGDARLRRSLRRSDRYRLAYENRGVVILRVVDDPAARRHEVGVGAGPTGHRIGARPTGWRSEGSRARLSRAIMSGYRLDNNAATAARDSREVTMQGACPPPRTNCRRRPLLDPGRGDGQTGPSSDVHRGGRGVRPRRGPNGGRRWAAGEEL